MKVRNVCCAVLLFLYSSLNAADTKMLDVGTRAGISALLPETKRFTIISHRMNLQAGINEMLQQQNMQHTESIRSLTDTIAKLARGLELHQTSNEKQHEKCNTFDLCMEKLHKDIEALKQHFALQIESMVQSAQESSACSTFNDISSEHSSKHFSMGDLIALCESMEVSHSIIKGQLSKKNDTITGLVGMIRRQDDDITGLRDEMTGLRQMILEIYKKNQELNPGTDTDSEYGSPSGCSSQGSSVKGFLGSSRPVAFSSLPSSPHRGMSSVRRNIIGTIPDSSQSVPVTKREQEEYSSSEDDVVCDNHSSSDDSKTGSDEEPGLTESPLAYRSEFSGAIFSIDSLIEPNSNTDSNVSESTSASKSAVLFLDFPGRKKGRTSYRRDKTGSKKLSSESTDDN